MKRLVLAMTCLAWLVGLAGCASRDIRPMPETMNSEGVILRTESVPLPGGFLIERRIRHVGPYWNDFFPLNYATADSAATLVSRLWLRQGLSIDLVAWAHMPNVATSDDCQIIAPDHQRIVFDLPEVKALEGQYPPQKTRDQRPQHVAVYSKSVGRTIQFDTLSGVYGVGGANHWRGDSDVAAITTFCQVGESRVRGLAVVSYGGRILADVNSCPDLAGLEFIAWSSDGRRIAALRPVTPESGGERGGDLVEFDLASGRVREAGRISPEQAVENLYQIERLIRWADGGVRLAEDLHSARADVIPK